MRHATRASIALMLLMLVLAACGGSTGSSPAADATDPAGASTTEPVDGDAGEPAATAAAAGGPGVGWATKPCDLLAQAQVEQAAGATGMTPTAVPMDASSGLCGYRAADNGAEVVLTIWSGAQAESMFTTLSYLAQQNAEGIERVDGLGADAIFSATDVTLFVSKNGTAVQVAVRITDRDPAALKTIALDLGRAIVSRL